MQYLKFLGISAILATRSVIAADVYGVPASSIELKLGFGSLKAALGDDSKISSLGLYFDSKVIIVPANELKDLDAPNLQKLRVFTTQSNNFKSPSRLKDGEYFIVLLEFGKPRDVFATKDNKPDKPDRIETVRNKVYFVFDSHGYFHRSRRVALGRDPIWTLYYKEPGKAEIQDGTESIEFDEDSQASPPSIPVRN